jgi:antitoxin VapB
VRCEEAAVPLSIKNPETEQLARELARETHESLTTAITRALEERLVRLRGRRLLDDRRRQALEIIAQCTALPDLDVRPADEVLGYDERGAFR